MPDVVVEIRNTTGPATTAGQARIDVTTCAGATAREKLVEGLRRSVAEGAVLMYPPGWTVDVGATPVDLPAHAELACGSGVATEFGRHARLNVRATGGQAIFRPLATSGDVNLGKGWALRAIEVFGTGKEDLFETQPGDSSGRIIAYSVLDNVCVNQMRRVYHGPQLGMKITGTTYWNNFTDTPFAPSGSDGRFFTDGLLLEMGGVVDAATRAGIQGMIRMGHLSKTYFGPVYVTGSPTLPISLAAGKGDVKMQGAQVEGRPSNGGGDLACWGPLMRLTGGGFKYRDGSLGYAMWKPAAGDRAYVHVSGGEHAILCPTYQPYPGRYVPIAYVEGGRLTIKDVQRDPAEIAGMKAAGVPKPVVLLKDIAPSSITDPAARLAFARDELLEADNTVAVKLAA